MNEALEQRGPRPRPRRRRVRDRRVAGRLIGIFTDGDLRRRVREGHRVPRGPISGGDDAQPEVHPRSAAWRSRPPRILKKHRIDELPVVDSHGKLCGIVDVQDLLEVGLMPLDTKTLDPNSETPERESGA